MALGKRVLTTLKALSRNGNLFALAIQHIFDTVDLMTEGITAIGDGLEVATETLKVKLADGSIARSTDGVKVTGLVVGQRTQIAQGADVASANNLVLGADGTVFNITGATQVNLLASTGWQQGSMVFLQFTSACVVKHGQTTSGANKRINLRGGVDFTSVASDMLALYYNGTTWEEVFRSEAGRKLGAKGADVASATNLTLGSGNYFDVTGTVTVTGIVSTGWTAGSIVVLKFAGILTLTHGTATAGANAGIVLTDAANITTAAGDTATLMYDGSVWRLLSYTNYIA